MAPVNSVRISCWREDGAGGALCSMAKQKAMRSEMASILWLSISPIILYGPSAHCRCNLHSGLSIPSKLIFSLDANNPDKDQEKLGRGHPKPSTVRIDSCKCEHRHGKLLQQQKPMANCWHKTDMWINDIEEIARQVSQLQPFKLLQRCQDKY